jgi:predicted RNA binding protein YcfA (HicA-like mRNA interferase family)
MVSYSNETFGTWKFITILNHPSKAVDPFLLKLIIQQAWITLEEFKKFL